VKIAVLVPCYNEEAAIATVVKDFRAALPDAVIYVYDNNSKDQTSARGAEAGAVVRNESRQGKGNVVRRMFADIEADIYVLVDGDDTYDASSAPSDRHREAPALDVGREGADCLGELRAGRYRQSRRPALWRSPKPALCMASGTGGCGRAGDIAR